MSDYEGAVKSAVRVVQVLELFEAERRALSVQDVVEALGVPQSSISSLLKTLVNEGYLTRQRATRRYLPSERLAFVGHWALGAAGGMAAIGRVMNYLSERTGESVLLGVQSGLQMRYVSMLESPHVLRFSLRPNQTRPLHGCGLGIMLLTRYSNAEIGAMVRNYNVEFTASPSPLTEAQVLEHVELARKQGYFETYGMVSDEVGTISTLLELPLEGRLLAVGLGGPLARLNPKREFLRELLMQQARAFSDSYMPEEKHIKT
ncbi:MAG: IclR family transcriptional regulator [Paracoccaceae bacterium]